MVSAHAALSWQRFSLSLPAANLANESAVDPTDGGREDEPSAPGHDGRCTSSVADEFGEVVVNDGDDRILDIDLDVLEDTNMAAIAADGHLPTVDQPNLAQSIAQVPPLSRPPQAVASVPFHPDDLELDLDDEELMLH